MESDEVTIQPTDRPSGPDEQPLVSPEARAARALAPQNDLEGCECGRPGGRCICEEVEAPNTPDMEATGSRYVYAIGRVEPRSPALSVEKELAQATGRAETSGLTDRQALRDVLSKRENRYLVRQLCYVLTIEGLETYILRPRDPSDFDQLVEAIRPAPSPSDLDVVIGVRGPLASPELCNGLALPIVAFDQIYSFDRDSLIQAIPRPEGMTAKAFEPAATELFERIIQIADNAGSTDQHRAINYLAVRYPEIYARAVDEFSRDFSLTGVDVLPSRFSSVRNIVDIVFSYTNRNTAYTEKYFLRVDVSEEFPYLVTGLSPYFDH